MKATTKDLRFHSKRLLEAVERGEEVVITFRGKPRARLVPIAGPRGESRSAAPAFGMWNDHDAASEIAVYVDAVRRPRSDAG